MLMSNEPKKIEPYELMAKSYDCVFTTGFNQDLHCPLNQLGKFTSNS